jgi:hypothetical protein
VTAQKPNIFISHHPKFDSGDLHLFHIHGYEIKTEIKKTEKAFISSLRRGYIGTFQLNEDGSLCLTNISLFTGRRSSEFQDSEVSEVITGNFHLDFREQFFGKRLFVPFEDGKIILDQSRWYKQIGSGRHTESGLIDEMFPNIKLKS